MALKLKEWKMGKLITDFLQHLPAFYFHALKFWPFFKNVKNAKTCCIDK